MLNIGEYIVKSGEGVCVVDSTVDMSFGTETRKYYLLIPVYDQKVKDYVPASGDHAGLRPVMTVEEAERLINEIPDIPETEITNEKLREQAYKDAIRSCDPRQLVGIIKNMYLRSRARKLQGKKTTAVDDRYFQMAEKALYSELGFILKKSAEEVRSQIIESAGGKEA